MRWSWTGAQYVLMGVAIVTAAWIYLEVLTINRMHGKDS